MKNNKTILITGASSGIGHALALAYATPGTLLLLTGRDQKRLEAVAALCRRKDALTETSALDITDRVALEKQVLAWDEAHDIDLVIANAGISGGMGRETLESEDRFRAIIATNIDGVFNTVNPLIPRMQRRKKGHIALMSSMAGFRGLPTAPAYSVSKCAVRAYGDALRPILKKEGITVSTIFPGFVKTPLTDANAFPMPFLMDADQAARIIRKGLVAKRPLSPFPGR